jgi:hypothetical protein
MDRGMTTPVDDTVLGLKLMSTRLICIDGIGSPSSPMLAPISFWATKRGGCLPGQKARAGIEAHVAMPHQSPLVSPPPI